MTIAREKIQTTLHLPDHKDLPESDGSFVKNFQEHPQSSLLTSCLRPVLDQLHPDGRYAIGQDCGIYWRLMEPLEKGAEAPDWFYVPNVTPLLDGEVRRSYVIWKEFVAPLLAIEFVSGDGSEERDRTEPDGEGAKAGKFWVYEQAIRIPFYAIYEVTQPSVEVYALRGQRYVRVKANARGHYPIAPLGIELGIWQGTFQGQPLPWLRCWDRQGNLLLAGDERAEQEAFRADQEAFRADQQTFRADQEALRADQQATRAQQEQIRADQEASRADREQERNDRLAAKLREMGIDPGDL